MNNPGYDRFLKDREIDSVKIETSKPLLNPEMPGNEEIIIQSGNPTPAETEFTVTETSNPSANGSITVQYEGEQVTTNYSSYQDAISVAYATSSNINNDPDIQVTATVPSGSTVLLTEKRDGCEYNGNTVNVSHTNGTHISVNDDTFYMDGGTDGVPCTPQLESPSNGANNVPVDLTLSWFSAAGASEYRVQVATDSGFSNLISDESGLSSTYYSPAGLDNSTTYYWRVNATNNEGTSNWSNTWSFTTSASTLYIDYDSGVAPCCENEGYIDMWSWSWASEAIDYIDVVATSFKDWQQLSQLFDGGNNRHSAAAGIREWKYQWEPESRWDQIGDHIFQDPKIPGGSLQDGTHDWTYF